MDIDIIVSEKGTDRLVKAQQGDLLLDVLRREGVFIQAPCGGAGKCRKCSAIIEGVGEVLTCMTRVDDELLERTGGRIHVILRSQGEAVIKSIGVLPEHNPDPIVWEMLSEITEPTVADQAADAERVQSQTGRVIPWHLIGKLPGILRKSDFKIKCAVRQDNNEIISVYSASEEPGIFGVAVDIGTTTLSVSLFDLGNGRYIASANALNPQGTYGADVISRIDHASSDIANLYALRKAVVDKILSLALELCSDGSRISVFTFAGNTTMIHLLCGHDPSAIAKAPFIPATMAGRILYFHEVFPDWNDVIPSDPVCMLIPSLSGYVGADITAGIIATDLDKSDKPALLVDIGTNGEIALKHDGRILCCSVAAGPAFEGANIACGTGGVSGAIDRTWIENGEIRYSTIGQMPPSEICGSGIVSIVSTFLDAGIIDETGRFCDDDSGSEETLCNGFEMLENERVFVFPGHPERTSRIYVTQKDIREIQNAKAAVCAGIKLLISRAGISPHDISVVHIAGGFGNFLDINEAFNIGLLPSELKGKVVSAGNTSAAGAALCMLDYSVTARLAAIAGSADYLELSTDSEFTELYVDSMFFEQE